VEIGGLLNIKIQVIEAKEKKPFFFGYDIV
jgi:hypothetical protein